MRTDGIRLNPMGPHQSPPRNGRDAKTSGYGNIWITQVQNTEGLKFPKREMINKSSGQKGCVNWIYLDGRSVNAWLPENQLMSEMTFEPEEWILGIQLMIAGIRIYVESIGQERQPQGISTTVIIRDSRNIGEYFRVSCNNKSNREWMYEQQV